VARIFAAKGRPSFNPLIVHVTSLADAEALGAFDAAAQRLARRFWPGPLTLVVRARAGNGIADLATAGLGTIALRVPAHPTARALIAASGLPLAAPSANKSGRLSPTCAADVAADFGPEIACVLDGGAAQHGLESTVIDATTDDLVLLRPGAVTAAEIEAATGKPLTRSEHAPDRPSSPGQLLSHYAPRARVRLDARDVGPGEALLAFGPDQLTASGPVVNLSERGDLVEAAARLFASLRKLDAALASPDATIAVMPIPEHGLGEAINDRLRRAAAAR
jgi:L-threonylcarbamoyladenylate synthase